MAVKEAKKTNKYIISKKWDTLFLEHMPGYNPFDQMGDCWFDENAAQDALDFFPECLTHIKGIKAGQRFELEPWQQATVACLFGWKRQDGTRRYRESFIYIARKNGKTAFAAGILLYGLLCDGEAGAEIYSAAADRAQATLVFNWVKGMIRASQDLEERTKIYQNSIVELDPDTGSETGNFYKAISAEAGTKHGYNSHLIIVDELHAQPNRELCDVLETSTGSRLQPLIIYITTADFARLSICNEKYDYACKVRDNIIEDASLLPIIFEASKDDDWTKPETWVKANPNMGIAVTPEYLTAKCKKAQDSPAFENTFKRLHLNIQTEQDVRWLNMEKWNACNEAVTLDEVEGLPCFAAMDLASNTDIACYLKLFLMENGMYAAFPKFYVPKDNAFLRERRDKVPYITWASQGFITLTEGNVIDYGAIKADLEKDWERFDIRELAFDRWQFEALRQQFVADGIPEDKMISFGQGFVSMSAPTKELEKLILSEKITHNDNPVLKWMARNVSVEIDAAGNIKPSKKKSTEKIDGIVSIIMSLGRAITQPLEDGGSVYDTRGITSL